MGFGSMKRINFYVRPHHIKTIKLVDKLRGNMSKSEFILKSIRYMADTHESNKDLLTPIDQPTLPDDWHIWKMYFQGMKLTTLVDSITKLDQLLRLAKQEVENR